MNTDDCAMEKFDHGSDASEGQNTETARCLPCDEEVALNFLRDDGYDDNDLELDKCSCMAVWSDVKVGASCMVCSFGIFSSFVRMHISLSWISTSIFKIFNYFFLMPHACR